MRVLPHQVLGNLPSYLLLQSLRYLLLPLLLLPLSQILFRLFL